MKKILQTLCLVLTLGFAFTACSDDDGPSLQPTLPASGADNVVQIEHQGSVGSCYDWSFNYSNKRLTRAKGTLRDADLSLDKSYQYTSNLSYGNQSVKLSNSPEESITVTINSQGYIGRIEVDRDIYNFAYNMNGQLTAWDKTEYQPHFGFITKYTSGASIYYDNNALSRIVYTGTDNSTYTITFTSKSTLNSNGLLPEEVSKELGLQGIEYLYYAGLMGKPTAYLVDTISFAYEDSTEDYSIKFDYHSSGGNTTLCNYTRPNGDIASVNYIYN